MYKRQSNIYWWPGAHGIVDFAPDVPSNRVVPVWFNVVPTMPKRWHMLVPLRPNAQKQCGSHVVPCGSNADDVASAPNLLSNRVVPAWFNVVPTMRKCWHMFVWQILCSSWLTAGLLLDAGSALAKGGQVMCRPQPLHQLPKLPSYVLSEPLLKF